jgi:hypothetical protein
MTTLKIEQAKLAAQIAEAAALRIVEPAVIAAAQPVFFKSFLTGGTSVPGAAFQPPGRSSRFG